MDYSKFDIDDYISKLRTRPEDYWNKKGEDMALSLFHEMSQRIPAYRKFLKINNVNPVYIKTIKDFNKIPATDKDNYLRKYPISELCWDGKFSNKRWTISSTSGSTGAPFYFPRALEQDQLYAKIAEIYLRENFQIHRNNTLYIVGFAMGAWIGGVFTYEAIRLLAEKGNYKLSVITPGIYKKEIIKAVKILGKNFDQIIIGGYPPFVKATIDEGFEAGVDWKEYDLGIIFSAEGFTEKFRDYIAKRTGIKNMYKRTLNHYGTVDMGTMAHETPLSIFIRRLALKNVSVFRSLFSDSFKLPTLSQYNPEHYYFESVNSNLLCTSRAGIPLVRYDLKDVGGVLSFSLILDIFKKNGIDLISEINKNTHINYLHNLPFVYVHERADFVVKLYGANIYPETIRKALFINELQNKVTGKFTMIVKYSKEQNQFLEINVELHNHIKPTLRLKKQVTSSVVKFLLKENSEYTSNYKESPKRQVPKILFWEYEHPTYFKPDGKQKWTI